MPVAPGQTLFLMWAGVRQCGFGFHRSACDRGQWLPQTEGSLHKIASARVEGQGSVGETSMPVWRSCSTGSEASPSRARAMPWPCMVRWSRPGLVATAISSDFARPPAADPGTHQDGVREATTAARCVKRRLDIPSNDQPVPLVGPLRWLLQLVADEGFGRSLSHEPGVASQRQAGRHGVVLTSHAIAWSGRDSVAHPRSWCRS